MGEEATFRRGAVRPMECFRAGWDLIKPNYWLFLGITLVGGLLAYVAPMHILVGPMMCGIFLCLFRQAEGRRVKFETLFKGFDYFVQSLIATLLMFIPVIVVVIAGVIVMFVLLLASAPGAGRAPGVPWAFFAGYGAFWALVFGILVVLHVLFPFVYPLIVDRKLSGIDALKTSFRAAQANLGGLIVLVLLYMLLELVGELACCVGQIFVAPVHAAAIAVAYRQVFPDEHAEPPRPTPEELDYDDHLDGDARPPERQDEDL